MNEQIKQDIEKMKAAMEQLKAAEVDKVETAATAIEQTFIQKYGDKVVKGVELVLLGLIAGRILGVI